MKRLGKAFVALTTATALGAAGFAGVSTAMAADKIDTSPGNITVNNLVAGDSVAGYRLLDIESYTGDCPVSVLTTDGVTTEKPRDLDQNNPNDKLSDCKIVYKLTSDRYQTAIITAADDMTGVAAMPDGANTDKDKVRDWVVNNINANNIDDFAKAFVTALDSTNTNYDLEEMTAGEKETSKTWTDKQVGYYLIKHTQVGDYKPVGDKQGKRTTSKYMVATLTKQGLTINLKNSTTTLIKAITNPNTDFENGDANASSYKVGDEVKYKLTGTIPANYDDFNEFKYTFTDILTEGLDFTGSTSTPATNNVEVTIDGKDVTNILKGMNPGIKVEGRTLTVDLGDLKEKGGENNDYINPLNDYVARNSTVVVTYSAIVNKNAKMGVAGNPNGATIKFTNSPSSSLTASTPSELVTVYEFQLKVNKVDGDDKPLDGAQFTLYAQDEDGKFTTQYGDAVIVSPVYQKATDETPAPNKDDDGNYLDAEGNRVVESYSANFPNLSAGLYRLSETQTPAGYNTAADKYLQVNAAYYKAEDTDLDGNEVGDLKALTVTVGTLDDDGNFQASGNAESGDITSGTIATAVINVSGKQLPSTGGMGTTILYIVGGLIVLAAAGGLTVAVRKRNN